MSGPSPFTRADLAADLGRLGVATGDVLMVHAGLRSVGPVLGGVNTVVHALLDAVGPTGTLVVYLDWEMGYEDPWLGDAVPAADPGLADAIPAFDPRIARASRSHGILPETIRTWPGALRSDHPDAGIAAVGARAAELCAEHPLDFGYGERTPYAKLIAMSAKILMLGAPLDTITLLHHAEDAALRTGKRMVRYWRKVLRDGAPVWVEIMEYDTTRPVVDGMPDDMFAIIGAISMTLGHGKRGRVGAAASVLLDAPRLHRVAKSVLESWRV